MVRVFIAVPVEDQKIISSLLPIQEELDKTSASIKFVERENFHILLKFLGNIPEEKISELSPLIKEVVKRYSPFKVEIKGLGCFPSLNYIRVIWAGISKGKDRLGALAEDIDNSLTKVGVSREDRKYIPHLTLGRVRKYKEEIKKVIRANRNLIFGELTVKEIRLFESKLSKKGPTYLTLEKYKL